MSAELDMSQYVDLFLQEADEQIEILEQETLKLEEDPTSERLQIIFRAAHTLKGSSRAMGFAGMAELTHEMENVLDQLREGRLLVSTEIADALLQCQDELRQMVVSIREGNGDQGDCSALVAQLQGFVNGSSAPLARDAAPAAASGPKEESLPLSHELVDTLKQAAEQSPIRQLRVRLNAECVMKFARAYMVTGVLTEVAELLATVPSVEDLEEEKFSLQFIALFQGGPTDDELLAQLKGISEIDSLVLSPWTAEATPELTVASNEAELAPAAPAAPVAPAAPAAPAAKAPSMDANKQAASVSGQTVRVDVTRLDALMNLIGELVIDRTRIAQIGSELGSKFSDPNIDALEETVSHIARITSDLQDQIMKARMMPIETVFNRFPRVVRDLAQKLGKDVKLELVGGETELDRSVIEVIGDPLLHILRNSVDHGLEDPDTREQLGKPRQGRVLVKACHQDNHIVIEISDDGRGIDAERIRKKAVEKGLLTKDQAERMTEREALQYIFSSGFSTAAEVSEVSGRGVGMDIVRSNLQRLGGLIDLETEVGKGSRFVLRLPLTLAIIRGLLTNVGEQVIVLPLGSVVETLLVEAASIQSVNRNEVIVLRGQTLPLVRLNEMFAIHSREDSTEDGQYVVVVGLAERRIGLAVDGLVGEKEVVIKSLSRFCGEVPGISGATILGDGNVALIADVNGIVLKESA
ncbi:MAG: chemotaxis protein CheW [Armatimonadota bacterium]|jgi:two-component system chemotaxis sensor kinase CheA|nr:chemotaxis protein CheA [Fimbriimonadaceae bacterium]MCZ8138392.1 chemotaxis protein CheA [Fimbriimonadaceae bacterium]